MKDRIIQFITKKELSYTKFADEIGVQRSSISHILSGRNKPSFDFIEKILKAYPDINTEWLILGKGNMIKKEQIIKDSEPEPELFNNTVITDKRKEEVQEKAEIKEGVEIEEGYMKKDEILHSDTMIKADSKRIERIIICYANGIFKEYLPDS